MLVKEGHEVVALTRDPQKFDSVEAMGAEPVLGDVFDAARLKEIAGRAEPEVIIHRERRIGATAMVSLSPVIIEGLPFPTSGGAATDWS